MPFWKAFANECYERRGPRNALCVYQESWVACVFHFSFHLEFAWIVECVSMERSAVGVGWGWVGGAVAGACVTSWTKGSWVLLCVRIDFLTILVRWYVSWKYLVKESCKSSTKVAEHWLLLFSKSSIKQEQTKFADLQRGITEDFQWLAKFQRTLSKSTKNLPISSNLRFWPFLTSKWPPNSNLTWSAQHNLGVSETFNFIKFSVWTLLRP